MFREVIGRLGHLRRRPFGLVRRVGHIQDITGNLAGSRRSLLHIVRNLARRPLLLPDGLSDRFRNLVNTFNDLADGPVAPTA